MLASFFIILGKLIILKRRQLLLVCLVLIALASIILPLRFEQPLSFLKSIPIDERLFDQSLFNMRQVFSTEKIRLPPVKTPDTLKMAVFNTVIRNKAAKFPTAWVVKVATTPSKTLAVKKVKQLEQQGLPAFYTYHADMYRIWIGPEVNLTIVQQWHHQIAACESGAMITRYQPI